MMAIDGFKKIHFNFLQMLNLFDSCVLGASIHDFCAGRGQQISEMSNPNDWLCAECHASQQKRKTYRALHLQPSFLNDEDDTDDEDEHEDEDNREYENRYSITDGFPISFLWLKKTKILTLSPERKFDKKNISNTNQSAHDDFGLKTKKTRKSAC